jgi:hypothetical protein
MNHSRIILEAVVADLGMRLVRRRGKKLRGFPRVQRHGLKKAEGIFFDIRHYFMEDL